MLQVPVFEDVAGIQPRYNYRYTFQMTVPTSLAAGTYYIVPLIAPVETTNYQKADVSRATAQRIKMEVKDGYAYFSYPDNSASDETGAQRCAGCRPPNFGESHHQKHR